MSLGEESAASSPRSWRGAASPRARSISAGRVDAAREGGEHRREHEAVEHLERRRAARTEQLRRSRVGLARVVESTLAPAQERDMGTRPRFEAVPRERRQCGPERILRIVESTRIDVDAAEPRAHPRREHGVALGLRDRDRARVAALGALRDRRSRGSPTRCGPTSTHGPRATDPARCASASRALGESMPPSPTGAMRPRGFRGRTPRPRGSARVSRDRCAGEIADASLHVAPLDAQATARRVGAREQRSIQAAGRAAVEDVVEELLSRGDRHRRAQRVVGADREEHRPDRLRAAWPTRGPRARSRGRARATRRRCPWAAPTARPRPGPRSSSRGARGSPPPRAAATRGARPRTLSGPRRGRTAARHRTEQHV